jgi:hypothetical protein
MQFNFIGRLLGPRGHSLKRIEATTGCRVFIRGKGSIKDPVKVNKFLFSQDGSSIMLFVVFYNFH